MPSKTLVHCGEKHAKMFKKSKDRVTLLAVPILLVRASCLTFIQTSQTPRCFKHMDMKLLPVHYCHQKKAWMDSHVFESWFHKKCMS